ncbi:MAG: CGNR zinc finger domain-containing protein, partial [Solirubrobacteraceae bacterium]
EHAGALALREALRSTMLAHTRDEPARGEALERAAARGELSIVFGDAGSVGIEARAAGFDGALARLLVPAAYASLDGTWRRVKACDDDGCLEAFYDRSRNRSGRWCDMAVCGNRTKVRAYRARREC